MSWPHHCTQVRPPTNHREVVAVAAKLCCSLSHPMSPMSSVQNKLFWPKQMGLGRVARKRDKAQIMAKTTEVNSCPCTSLDEGGGKSSSQRWCTSTTALLIEHVSAPLPTIINPLLACPASKRITMTGRRSRIGAPSRATEPVVSL